jgi:site-specific DNA recombinase
VKHTGPAPFGFAWQGDGLCPVEAEVKIRKLAFTLYVELQSKAAVAERLNSAGHRTRRGNLWRDVTVARLLSCASARGVYALNKTTTDKAGKRIEKPEDEWSVVACPAIVSEELWKTVQATLSSDAPPTQGGGATTHPFTGLLYCQCGARMNVASSSPKYVCSQCGVRIPISDLEDIFLEEITNFLRARQSTAAEIIHGDPELAVQQDLLREAEAQLKSADEETTTVERLYMENKISLERFEKIHRPLEDRRRALQREIGRIKAKISRIADKRHPDEQKPAFDPKTLRQRWPLLPATARREIVQGFVSRINVGTDELEFTYRFREISERTAKARHLPGPTFSPSPGARDGDEPLYIRLPKPGQLCPLTGMTRSALNELILASERNNYQPPVESKSLRKREGGKGTRLIVWQSLKAFLSG